MPNQLTNIEVHEVSLVPKAANMRKFLLTKSLSAEPNEEVNSLIESIEKIKKNLSPEAQKAVSNALDTLRDAGDEIPANVIRMLTALVGASQKQDDGDDDDDDDDNPMHRQQQKPPRKGEAKMSKQATTKEEILKSVSDEMRPIIEQLWKEKEDAENLIKEQKDAAKKQEYITKAATYTNLPIKAEEFGLVLKELSEKAPEALAKLEEVLKSVNEQLGENVLMKEIGGNGSGLSGQQSMTKVEKAAEAVRQANPSFTKEQAITKALELNPELYNDYLENRY